MFADIQPLPGGLGSKHPPLAIPWPLFCVSEERLGMLFGALWPLGGASGRSFVALQAPGNQEKKAPGGNMKNHLQGAM